jgi:low affinity Fe/Cu permease
MSDWFRRFAHFVSVALGSPLAFLLACIIIGVWIATGPIFHYSDTWQLIINTGTTIVTFLAVFLIQHTQNRDAREIHVKLDELIRANRRARNAMINLEILTDAELEQIHAELIQQRDESMKRINQIMHLREKSGKKRKR